MRTPKIILLLTSVLVLANCSFDTGEYLIDSDYDGLYDKIDPAPNDNHYQLILINKNDENDKSNKIDVTVDYRNFLEDKYNNNLAMLASFLINEVSSGYMPSVTYNSYKQETSEFAPILTQIGCDDITWLKLSDKPQPYDPYDIANLLAGHHTFKVDEQLYQVFFFLIHPYPFRTGWVSNFDLGGTTTDGKGGLEPSDAFKVVEGEVHPEWINYNHHKGFDVTANRLVGEMTTYIKENKEDNAETIVFTTGHSRGGALTNLATKALIDKGYHAMGYAFNPPKTTITTIEERTKYKDAIFNFVNANDIVSRIPLTIWGFDYYGETYVVNVGEHSDIFKNMLNREYEFNEDETLTYAENKLADLCKTDEAGVSLRDNEYEFYYKEWTAEFDNEEEANEFIDNIQDLIPLSANSISTTLTGNNVVIKLRPSILMGLIAELMDGNFLFNIDTYLTVLIQFALELVESIIDDGISLSINGFRLAHEQPIACVLAKLAK